MWMVLAAGVVGWVLFALARYSDVAIETSYTWEQLWGDDTIAVIRPSTYLTVAALAVIGVGALLARRAMSRPTPSALSVPVRDFAGTILIITMILSAIAAIGVFLGNVFEGVSEASIGERVLISYLPIVLYTVLVVTLLLVGFVFQRRVGVAPHPAVTPDPAVTPGAHEATPAAHGDDHEGAPAVAAAANEADVRDAQRSTALAYAVPIIAVAIALIFGLIVYDLTRTALEAWIWVVVQTIVGVGIVAGTLLATRAARAVRRAATGHAGASVGAKILNLVLSIIYAAAVSAMSLGYTADATEQLRYQPILSLSAYANVPGDKQPGVSAPIRDVSVMVDGSDLQAGTEAVVTLEPSGERVASARVDSDGFLWTESTLPPDLPEGEGDLTVTATSSDGSEVRVSVAVSVSDGTITLPPEAFATLGTDEATILPISAAWVFDELLPAFVLLLLVIATLHLTLTGRNPELRAADFA